MNRQLTVIRNDGGALTAELYGRVSRERPAIVCWPGAGQGADALAPLGNALLANGWPNVIIGPRGTGVSGSPRGDETMAHLVADAKAIIEEMAGGPVVMLGVAFGNRVARAVSKYYPELVCGVVLLAAGGEVPPHTERGKQFLAQLRASTRPSLRMCVQIASDTPHAYFGDGGEQPMLLLHGEQDEIAPRENATRLAARCRHRVSLVEIAGAGHNLFKQQPGQVIGAIRLWLSAQFGGHYVTPMTARNHQNEDVACDKTN